MKPCFRGAYRQAQLLRDLLDLFALEEEFLHDDLFVLGQPLDDLDQFVESRIGLFPPLLDECFAPVKFNGRNKTPPASGNLNAPSEA